MQHDVKEEQATSRKRVLDRFSAGTGTVYEKKRVVARGKGLSGEGGRGEVA